THLPYAHRQADSGESEREQQQRRRHPHGSGRAEQELDDPGGNQQHLRGHHTERDTHKTTLARTELEEGGAPAGHRGLLCASSRCRPNSRCTPTTVVHVRECQAPHTQPPHAPYRPARYSTGSWSLIVVLEILRMTDRAREAGAVGVALRANRPRVAGADVAAPAIAAPVRLQLGLGLGQARHSAASIAASTTSCPGPYRSARSDTRNPSTFA